MDNLTDYSSIDTRAESTIKAKRLFLTATADFLVNFFFLYCFTADAAKRCYVLLDIPPAVVTDRIVYTVIF